MIRCVKTLGAIALVALGTSACSGYNEPLSVWGPDRPEPIYTAADQRAIEPYNSSAWFRAEQAIERYNTPKKSATPPDPYSGQTGYQY